MRQLRFESRKRRLARMIFLGWSTEKCARALHCSPDTVRDTIATPEFQELLGKYESDAMARVDRAMPRLLMASVSHCIGPIGCRRSRWAVPSPSARKREPRHLEPGWCRS